MAVHKSFVVVLLSLHVFSYYLVEHAHADVIVLPQTQMSALQSLYRNWSMQTEDLNSRLPGWTWFDPNVTPDQVGYIDPCYFNSWRGVFCDIVLNTTAIASGKTGSQFDARVVSITVSDASIVGTLPVAIWDLINLVSLTVTENPHLSGAIPDVPASLNIGWPLKSLDLHGNGLSGLLPGPLFEYFRFIEDLDLSNNRLSDAVPASLGHNLRLRSLKLSNNSFAGILPWDIAINWTELVTADLSDNKFTGEMINLNFLKSLRSLNFSHNNFSGHLGLKLRGLQASAKQSLAILDLSYNSFTGPIPNLGGWPNLTSLSLSYNKFDAEPCPSWLSSLTSLESLDLSGTSLTGKLDLSMFSSLKQLMSLELNDNNITGTLNIDGLTYNGTLQTISLRGNKISQVIFSSNSVSALQNFSFQLQGNPYCNSDTAKYTDTQKCLCEQRCYDTNQDATSNKKIIVGSAVGGSLAALMLIIAALLYWKNRRDRHYLLLAVHEKFAEYEMKPTLFAYSELQKATRDFHNDNKLGEGGFGAVYKGTLADGSVVAVKQLLSKVQQNMDDFLNEVVLLTSVKHRNLVKLKGCCLRGDRRLLVYEFVDNYDLAEILFERRGNQLVAWPARFNICLGVAQGLHYLHAGVDPKIIHRDIKANNVLLDSNLQPKIADFGLAMLFPNKDTHITIVQIAGTKGYLAPEYATRGQVSDKVDVFSFGVVALEVVSGRKNISFAVPPDEAYLTDWAWKLSEQGRLMDLVDPTLSGLVEEAEVHRVVTTALACIQAAAERRPTMAQVVGMLQGDIEITEAVRGQMTDNQSHRILLGLTSSATTLMPVAEESQVSHIGEGSDTTGVRTSLIQYNANISGR